MITGYRQRMSSLLLQLLLIVIVHMATNIMLPEGLSNYDAANMLVKAC